MYSPFIAPSIALSFMFLPVAFGQTYRIKLERPEKVGNTYTISVTADAKVGLTEQKSERGAKPADRELTRNVRLDATIGVLAVDNRGRETAFTVTVSRFLINGDSALDAGTVITADQRGGKVEFTAKGMKIDDEADVGLIVALLGRKLRAPSDDLLLGTDQPQAVGGTWPLHTNLFTEFLTGVEGDTRDLFFLCGGMVDPQTIRGDSRLVAVEQHDGKAALRVDSNVMVDAAPVHESFMSITTDQRHMAMHLSSLVPVDPIARPLEQIFSHKTTFHMKSSYMTSESHIERLVKIVYGKAQN